MFICFAWWIILIVGYQGISAVQIRFPPKPNAGLGGLAAGIAGVLFIGAVGPVDVV